MNYSCEFVLEVEEAIYNSLVSLAPEVIGLEGEWEEDNPNSSYNEKNVASVKCKAKGKKVATK